MHASVDIREQSARNSTLARDEARGGAEAHGGAETRGGAASATRGVARALTTLAAAAVLAACGGDQRPAATPAGGSTLQATYVDKDGDGFLERGAGEPFVDRGRRAKLGATLATFAQLTDTHVRDEESPARVPFLDRIGAPFTSTFRPQEAFSTQTLDAAVRAVNQQRPQAVFITGDITDNAQRNELTMALDTLNGKTVHPDTGKRGYDGVQDADEADPFYYRPDHDAPTHPGAIEQAQRPFKAAGLNAPYYPLVGNHDVLAQGEVPPTPAIDAFATGDRLVPSLDPDLRPPTREVDAKQAVAALLSGSVPLDTVHTPPDPDRAMNKPGEAERRLGHPNMDYTVDLGARVKAILIDTVNRDGSSQARITPPQIEWLKTQLNTPKWVLVFSHNPLTDAALEQLDAHPNVVASIAGNSHKNRIAQRGRYWQITTSSLADFPEQARMFRLRATDDGVALETWMVDHDGRGLAGISRELAYLDAQGGRPQHFAGKRSDRNATLFLSDP
ncbi:metallophosphoesterase family protein [Solirubrobacter soli]|uniref:metallophosphoesterase family protein n=1 Tax=Solirubrobacter soli TaxID=363832 RepID=UPI0003FFA580|nr:metallophosphoesterase [Solirubrobacter soli]